MRPSLLLCLLLAGCPGRGPAVHPADASPAQAPVATAPAAPPAPPAPPAAPAEPPAPPAEPPAPSPAPPKKCDEVRAAYQRIVMDEARLRCASDGDCQVLGGQCATGLGGCYHALNRGAKQEQLDVLGARFQALGCTAGVCRCARPPAARCTAGRCALP